MTTRLKSVAKSREDRREHDAYETPPDLCTAVVQRLHTKGLRPNRILEPGCGRGNFIRAARDPWPTATIVGSEIRAGFTEHKHVDECWDKLERKGKPAKDAKLLCNPLYLPIRTEIESAGATEVLLGDFLTQNWLAHFDLAIGNPPYGDGLAEKFVEKSVSLLNPGGVLAFVLKMHFFGTKKRIPLWNSHPFFVAWPIVPRPDFTGDGRDTSEYVLIAWHRDSNGGLLKNCELHTYEPLEWR